MGILNLTPDSFSDGGRFADEEAALAAGLDLIAEGADLLDLGGESTRPGAAPVSAAEEKRRILGVIEGLARATEAPISVDTRKAEVAAAALSAGASIVNDISGLGDPEMAPLLAERSAGVVLMHMRGEPRTMQDDPRYDDPVAEILGWLEARVERALAAGIAAERIAIDPGLGFGKRPEDNVALMGSLERFHELGRPLVLGASRKTFLGRLTGVEDPRHRIEGSLAAAARAADAGVEILRVHDVAATRRFLDAYLPMRRGDGAAARGAKRAK